MTSHVMSSIEKRVGARIAQRRRLAGLSQARLAERIGVTTETISRIETGTTSPPLRRIESIAKALGVELHDLLRAVDARAPEDAAVERLLRLVSKKPAYEIEFVVGIAAMTLEYMRRRPA